jgi:hypothetical protein
MTSFASFFCAPKEYIPDPAVDPEVDPEVDPAVEPAVDPAAGLAVDPAKEIVNPVEEVQSENQPAEEQPNPEQEKLDADDKKAKEQEENIQALMREAQDTKTQLNKANSKIALMETDQSISNMSLSGTSLAEVVRRGDKFALIENEHDNSLQDMSVTGLELVLPEKIDGETDEINLKNDVTLDSTMSDTEHFDEDSFASSTGIPVSLHKVANIKVQQIGKHIKNSKMQATWKFEQGSGLDAISHVVTLTWSKCSGRVVIHMDEEEVYSTKLNQPNQPFFVHKWKTNAGLKMNILASQKINKTLSLKNHDLTINGERFVNLPDALLGPVPEGQEGDEHFECDNEQL